MRASVYFILILFAIIDVSFAQNECGMNFELISKKCIKQFEKGFVNKTQIVLTKEKINQVYYFKTSENNLGKFLVKSIHTSATECTIQTEPITFTKKSAFKSPGTLSIKKEFNIWNEDFIGFDKSGHWNDFKLVRDEKNSRCLFKPNAASIYKGPMIETESLLQGSWILFYSSMFLIGLAVFLVAHSIFRDEEKFKAQEKLEDAEEEVREPVTDFVLKYSQPFFKRYFTPIVGGMKNKRKIKDKYKKSIASSGLTKVITPEDFFAFKLFLIIGFPIVFLAVRAFLEEEWPLIIIPLISVLGFFYPDIWIKGKCDRRKEELIKGMPFIVDMLALSVEAGLDFMAAIQKVIDKAPRGPMVDEFEILIKDTKVGASRAEGLRQLSWRADSLPISSFCATLIAADSVGANIAPILKTLSVELRGKRSAAAEKQGATAATKILVPMIMFILPAVIIMIGLPVAMQFF